MTSADTEQLQDVFRRESRSLLQYARESSPYASGDDRRLLAEVQRVATEETTALADFGGFLADQRVPLPYLSAFPMVFTDLNFVTVRYLLPKLVAEQKRDLAQLEAAAGALTDPPSQAAVRGLVDLHHRHLKELEKLV